MLPRVVVVFSATLTCSQKRGRRSTRASTKNSPKSTNDIIIQDNCTSYIVALSKHTMKRGLACKHFHRTKVVSESRNGTDKFLEKATKSVQNDQPVDSSFESLYMSISNLLDPRYAKDLWQKLDKLIDDHTRSVLERFKQNDYEPMHFLNHMNECWRNYCRQLSMIKGIYLFLDRKYVLSDTSVISIWDLGIEKFKNYFSGNTIVQERTVNEILNLIEQERRGSLIDRALVKDLLGMLSGLSLYRTIFEPKFLKETHSLYKMDSQRLVRELDVPEYLEYVMITIQDESTRAYFYLETLTHVPLLGCVETELIANHLESLLTKGLDQLLDDLRMCDLVRLHKLCGRVENGLTELCAHFNKYIKRRGLVIVTNVARDKTMVQDLLEFKDRMNSVVNECFEKQERFVNTLKEAFENFINKRPNKPAELIAKYIDSKLKSGNKEASEEELERMLDSILVLFRFIHGKDVFEAFYKKDLAKRLLVNKSASVDAEKSMLSKLKQECGAAFTSKLEGMFRDIELSKDMMTHFKKYIQSLKFEQAIDMTVSVLTMGFWPTYQPVEVNLPPYMLKYQDSFVAFYNTKHHGRKLQWQPNLGNCTLIATFHRDDSAVLKDHELVVSQFQALVLLLFNAKDELSYLEIHEATNLEHVELKRTLQSLACGKYRIIVKEPKGKDIDESDKFIFHHEFKCQLHKVKINQVQLKETQEEQEMTEERIFQDRQYQIDAAIVRIMKTRKKLAHTTLVNEVFEHLKFPVRAHDLKVRIESLIERDYLSRDKENANEYNYVA